MRDSANIINVIIHFPSSLLGAAHPGLTHPCASGCNSHQTLNCLQESKTLQDTAGDSLIKYSERFLSRATPGSAWGDLIHMERTQIYNSDSSHKATQNWRTQRKTKSTNTSWTLQVSFSLWTLISFSVLEQDHSRYIHYRYKYLYICIRYSDLEQNP